MNNVTVQFPFLSILFFVFLILKLTGYIAWSWWWITAPLWIPCIIFLLMVCFVGIFALIYHTVK